MLVSEDEFLQPLIQESGWRLGEETPGVVVLSTYGPVWWASQGQRPSSRAAPAISQADRLDVPAIVFWKTLLVRKRKLDLGTPIHNCAATIKSIPRIDHWHLTAAVALPADPLNMRVTPLAHTNV